MQNYIVLHTHWDREWYFTTSDSLVLMDRTFKNIITELELYPEISFCLDGQYSIIEEFLSINPELEQKVAKLVKENRLQIGPWYTQTDTQLVAGESIVRNLYYGMNKTINRFGKVMEVGYLPDTFGFCNQMPEIYNLAGINKAVFWRGAEFTKANKPYFLWQGCGNSIVKTINLYGGYGMAKGFSANNDFVTKTLKPIINNYKELGINGEIIIPVGNDQFEIKADVPKMISQIKKTSNLDLKISDYETSIEEIFNNQKYEKYQGEFRKTAYTRLHKSIGSVRYDLKQNNYDVEQTLINEIEPLFVISKQFDINPSINLLYSAWSLLFEGHAHDGICGCVSDAVYDDMINRIKRANEIAASLKNLMLKEIAQKLNVQNSDVLLINTSTLEQELHEITVYTKNQYVTFKDVDSEIISTEIIEKRDDALVETATGNIYEKLPQMYCHKILVKHKMAPLTIKVLNLSNEVTIEKTLIGEKNIISNQIMNISIENNKINLNINNQKYEDIIKLIDVANDGDTYDFSPLKGDQEIDYKIISYNKNTTKFKEEFKIKLMATLPKSLDDRIENTNLCESIIVLTMSLKDNDDKLYCQIDLNNNILSHKLMVRINVDTKISNTISSSAYGEILRDVYLNDEINNWEETNVEKPVSIETFDGFVRSKDSDILIISDFGKEYQAHQSFIDLTVFATTGELGKSNLIHRPGRASGDVTKKGHVKIMTPKAQCLGAVNFSFALSVATEDFFENMKKVYAYRTNTINYQVQDINKFARRIDNKLMEYRQDNKKYTYTPINITTNGLITSFGIDLNGSIIIRGVCNDNHQFTSNKQIRSINLLGENRTERFNKFNIFNYKVEEEL